MYLSIFILECELAAINAESNSPPRNRVCVENGSFKRKSKQDGASITPSPRLSCSSSFSASLPSIPAYAAVTNPDSLSASTSIIPQKVGMSPPSPPTELDTTDPIELNPDVSVWNKQESLGDNEASTSNSTDTPANSSTTEISQATQELTDKFSTTSLTNFMDSVNNTTTTNTNNTEAQNGTSTPRSSSPTLERESSYLSVTIPSYASAVPHSPATAATASQQEQIDHADKAFGSTFSFRLRQLSGEGKSGKQRVYEYFYTELHMINSLFNISTALMSISLDNIPKLKEVRGTISIIYFSSLFFFYFLLFFFVFFILFSFYFYSFSFHAHVASGRALHLLLAQLNTQLIQSEYHSASSSGSLSNNSYESSVLGYAY